MRDSYKVAVIGGGIAGLVSARELQREGHHVTVFEKANRVGGTWLYDPRVETDLLGLDPNREIVHSSLYRSLRVNLPRQIMGFLDYPFVKKEGGDPRHFPGHEEDSRDRVELGIKAELFEAVVICNGHNTEPKTAKFPGKDTWPGLQMHSHNYRTPEPFKNKIVVLIGNGPSAIDILKELAPVAKQVHQAIRRPGFHLKKLENHDNAWQHSMIACAHKDGKVVFQDESVVEADAIIHCTGYKFHFPFLRTNGIVNVDDTNRVEPLYKHVFPPSLAPWLSFVGPNYEGVPGAVMELQARWVAKVLSGKLELPSQEEMMCAVEEHWRKAEKNGWPKPILNPQHKGFEYIGWFAARLDIRPPNWWKKVTFWSILKVRSHYGDDYRDTWDIHKWMQEMDSPD
ncbi:hypothetical protein like AT1G62620 [Hibiscus trionum]|uniref:Flavin-containing monooxygenase n=1 Tax=Hibiscus trionum TaxID=183268 RepID=A0A9W7IQK1_HIBTR|nr:hypothetical protein like AT1G62620 [Hibiscus trionum]